MLKRELQTEQERLVSRLSSIGHSTLCDPECYGRCKECPADIVEDAIKFIRAVRQVEIANA